MSRRLSTALLLTTSLLVPAATALAGAPAAAVTGSCAPKDARSDRLIATFKAFVGKTDMGGTIEKTTMGVAAVTPAQVVLVTDTAVCTKAAAAFDAKQVEKRARYALHVVALGASYGVLDTKVMQAGFDTASVFDSNWKYKGVKQVQP